LWQDRYDEAISTAHELQEFLLPHIGRMPDLEYYLLAPLQVYLYFHKWNEILNVPKLPEPLAGAAAFWHFARAHAYVSLGDLKKAESEKELFFAQKESLTEAERLGYNPARQVLDIAEDILAASFAKANGDFSSRIQYLRSAVSKQDLLNYNEPPDWFYPIRQTLGAALIDVQHPQEAELVFRQALERLPRNGRSLFGLLQSLKAQEKFDYWIEREVKEALKYTKHPLNLNDL